MTGKEEQQDLVVLAADRDMEFALRGIVSRHQSLRIKKLDVKFLVHLRRDPGCRTEPEGILRLYCHSHRHALVLLDHEGSGGEKRKREDIEAEIEAVLSKNGWGDRAAAVVIAPELEAWVWSSSPHVDEKLGWANRSPTLCDWLRENTAFWPAGHEKPTRPKEAMQEALYKTRKPRSASTYKELAKAVSLKNCSDPAFAKLTQTLKKWFGS